MELLALGAFVSAFARFARLALRYGRDSRDEEDCRQSGSAGLPAGAPALTQRRRAGTGRRPLPRDLPRRSPSVALSKAAPNAHPVLG